MSSRAAHLPYRDIMAARGWTWNEEYQQFHAHGSRDERGHLVLRLRVGRWTDGTWIARYGVPGVGYEQLNGYETPMEAANEAEAWLRGVLAPFTFPWLHIDKATP